MLNNNRMINKGIIISIVPSLINTPKKRPPKINTTIAIIVSVSIWYFLNLIN